MYLYMYIYLSKMHNKKIKQPLFNYLTYVVQVTSYGGKLIYNVLFDISSSRGSEGLVRPDVRIQVNK